MWEASSKCISPDVYHARALGSLSFVPVIEKQIFNPVEEYRILSNKAGVIHLARAKDISSSSEIQL
jgi:hypothetical protein